MTTKNLSERGSEVRAELLERIEAFENKISSLEETLEITEFFSEEYMTISNQIGELEDEKNRLENRLSAIEFAAM